MKKISLTKNMFADIDDEDFLRLSRFVWHAQWTGNHYYASCKIVDLKGKRKTVLMHRMLMNPSGELHVDHIDGNTLNNSRSNLRICTRYQNLANRGATKRNKIGFKGVTWDKNRKLWKAYIGVNNKGINLGRFITPVEAAKAYNFAAIQYHGEFAYLNKI